jgi:hypothetical protein
MHQIRKMMSCVVMVARGLLPSDELVPVATRSPFKLHFPLAPGFPLLLDYTPQTYPNHKRDAELAAFPKFFLDLDPEARDAVARFKRELLYPHIQALSSSRRHEMEEWLAALHTCSNQFTEQHTAQLLEKNRVFEQYMRGRKQRQRRSQHAGLLFDIPSSSSSTKS